MYVLQYVESLILIVVTEKASLKTGWQKTLEKKHVCLSINPLGGAKWEASSEKMWLRKGGAN